ncbi:MAG TPA: hypothetical protein VM053_05475 [Gemmatimonadaceae bacterium]|nr:hypothetical protein [Gemmatimonadaceae bacterium]
MRELNLYELLGRKVCDANDEYAGCIEEIEVERGDEKCAVKCYLVAHRGLIARITSWAIADSLQKAIPVSEKSLPYRVPWNQMDLTVTEHPRITVAQAELRKARSEG